MLENCAWLVASGNLSTPVVHPQLGWFLDWRAANVAAHAQWGVEYDRYLAAERAASEEAARLADEFQAAFDVVTAAGVTPSFAVHEPRKAPMSRAEWTRDRLNDRYRPLDFHQVAVEAAGPSGPTGDVWLCIDTADGRARLSKLPRWYTSETDAAEACDDLNAVSAGHYAKRQAAIVQSNTDRRARFEATVRDAGLVRAAGLPVPFVVPEQPQLVEDLPPFEQWRAERRARHVSWYEPTVVEPAR